MVQRVGILGGTFDPVHIGHLRIAEEALEALELDRLVFIPAADPPHKIQRDILPFEHRWRMLALSIEGNPLFFMSDIEQQMAGKSYTVLTLQELQRQSRGREEYFFLVGLDAFLELNTWYRYRQLFALAHLVVLRRPGHEERSVAQFLHEKVSCDYHLDPRKATFLHPTWLSVHLIHNTELAVSSTLIRSLARQGRSIRYLVVDDVMRYICEQKLYRNRPQADQEPAGKQGWDQKHGGRSS